VSIVYIATADLRQPIILSFEFAPKCGILSNVFGSCNPL